MSKRPLDREPLWVGEQVVRAVHQRQLAEHGGGDGVRDESLLISALNRPKSLFDYGDPAPDLAALAAAYAYGLCRNHPYVDGNKRTSLIICQLFLKLNGAALTAPPMEKYTTFMKLAAGELGEAELADWMRGHITL